LFVGKCVRENELEKLKGVAMAASNKLFFISGAGVIIKKMLYN